MQSLRNKGIGTNTGSRGRPSRCPRPAMWIGALALIAWAAAAPRATAQDLNIPNNTIVDETADFAYQAVTVGDGATLNIGDPPNPVTISAALTTTLGVGSVLRVLDNGTYVAASAINLNGSTIQVDLGGTFDANAVLVGGVTGDTVIVNGVMTYDALQFGLGLGDDVLSVSGSLTVNLGAGNVITLNDGDDLVVFTAAPGFSLNIPGINAGAGNQPNGDTLRLNGTGSAFFNGAETLTNFEHLEKEDTSTWSLTQNGATAAAFETVTVTGGTLQLFGLWEVSGLTVLAANTTLQVGSDTTAATYTSADQLLTGGLFHVGEMGEASFVGNLTVSAGGEFRVDNGGLANTAEVNLQAGGQMTIAGTMMATNTAIAAAFNVQSTGSYTATGTTAITGTGALTVSGGSYATTSTFTATDMATVTMSTGSITSDGLVIVNGMAVVTVQGGNFNANGASSLGGNGRINVFGGNYVAGGMILIDDNDRLTVDDQFVPNGVVFAGSTTQVQGMGQLVVQAGAYNATGQIVVTGNAIIAVSGTGVISALGTTNVDGNGTLVVFDGGEFQAAGTISVLGGSIIGQSLISGMQLMDNTGGTISPGLVAGATGTLSFIGTYQQSAGGMFLADVTPAGISDLFAITGPASLGGSAEINLTAGIFAGVLQTRILSSTAPIPTFFDTVTVSGAAAGDVVVWIGRVDDAGQFDANDPSTGNNVDVIVVANSAFGAIAETPNQQAVADYLGLNFPGGTLLIEDPFFFDLLGVLALGPNALDQIGGEVYDSFTAFSFDIARQFGNMIDNRVRTLRCTTARRTGASAPFCKPGRTLLADAGPGLDPGAPGTVSPVGFSPNTHPYGWSVWAQAVGSHLSLDRTSTNLGYSGWTGGGVMGVDLALSERWIVGVLAGGTHSSIDFSGVSGDGGLDAMTVGLYTAWYGTRWFTTAAFLYTKTWVDADRDLTFLSPTATANGKTEGDQYAIHATVGYGFKIRRWTLEATGGLDWIQLRQKAFTETGAGGFNLSVRSRTDDSLRLRIGVRIARAWKLAPNVILAPSFRVGYAREVLDNTRAITSSLAGIGGSFTVHGDEGSRNILTYGSSIQLDLSQGITFYLAYAGEWAGDRQSHALTSGMKIRW